MKLMYGWQELLPTTRDYARKRWGREPEFAVSEEPVVTGGRSSGFAVDDPPIEEFEGAITERDDEYDDCVYLTVTSSTGAVREFSVDQGKDAEFQVGRRMVVRFVETGRLRNGDQMINVAQIWLG
jgi:hypothetical protein